MKPNQQKQNAVDQAVLNKQPLLIHNPSNDPWNLIKAMIRSDAQRKAFYVVDVADIVRKLDNWKQKMPRVAPFYGIFLFSFQNCIL